MGSSFKWIQTVVLASILMACAQSPTANNVPCTPYWFAAVNDRLAVSDEQGHGPDHGSAEWRSAVEFKLAVRGKPNRPKLLSDKWCNYIETVLNKG